MSSSDDDAGRRGNLEVVLVEWVRADDAGREFEGIAAEVLFDKGMRTMGWKLECRGERV